MLLIYIYFNLVLLCSGIARCIVKANGVGILCDKMSLCEIPDLSENAINCINKISFDYGDMAL